MKRRIISLLLVVILALTMTTGALAAPAEGANGLRLDATVRSNYTIVRAYLTAEGATNGRIVLDYDPDLMQYEGLLASNPLWVTNLNSQKSGQVAFAWVASDLGAKETLIASFLFTAKYDTTKVTEETYSAEVTELYDSGVNLLGDLVANGTNEDEITVKADRTNSGIGGQPDVQVPTVPGDKPVNDDVRTNPFVDINGHWAEDYILEAYYAGLVNGMSANTFGPEIPVTRGMFVTLLYRLAGEPAAAGAHPFTDVPNGKYYTNAVKWAYANGVVNGTSETTFSPEANVTRQQLVTMLYRYADFAGMDTDASASLTAFADADSVAEWAKDAMQWAVAEGIISGMNGALAPNANTTRAQAATILVRFAD